MLEKSHHGSFESCDGTIFLGYPHPRSGDTRPHLSSLYRLSICLSLSLWACVAPPGLYYTWSFIPHLTTQSLRSFVFRWGLTLSSSVTTRDSPSKFGLSSRCSIGSNNRAPLGLWIITSSWLSAYHHFLTVTPLQDAEQGHVF